MKYFIILLLSLNLMASKVFINADEFKTNMSELLSTFSGNVHFKMQNNTISADKIVVHFTKDKKPNFYEIIGNIKANMDLKGRKMSLVAGSMKYFPKQDKVELRKNVVLKEKDKSSIIADEVLINLKTYDVQIKSDGVTPISVTFEGFDIKTTKGDK